MKNCMRISTATAFLAMILCISITDANAATTKSNAKYNKKVQGLCRNVTEVTSGGLFIYKNSAPLRSGGVGTPLVGYRKEPTLIMNRNVSSRGTSNVYDHSGNRIGSCPWASAEGHSGGRYRCTMQTSSLRRTAVKNTRKASVLIKINSSTCVNVPDAGRCYGSVKGLCNQTIK